jgi:hypothetical protein
LPRLLLSTVGGGDDDDDDDGPALPEDGSMRDIYHSLCVKKMMIE